MEANKVDSEKCLALASQYAVKNEFDKAIRFVEKSIKLYPTDKAQSKYS
jgi:prefoldin subunit 5